MDATCSHGYEVLKVSELLTRTPVPWPCALAVAIVFFRVLGQHQRQPPGHVHMASAGIQVLHCLLVLYDIAVTEAPGGTV